MTETVAALAEASVAAVAVNASCWRTMMRASEQRLVEEGLVRVYAVMLVMEAVKLVANTMTAVVEILPLVADSLVAVFQKESYAEQALPNWS